MSDHYISIPRSGSGHGVLVLHAWWGLNPFVRRLCGRLAQAGYTALAPDLFDGEVATTVDGARALRAKAMSGRREPAYRLGPYTAVFGRTVPPVIPAGIGRGGHGEVIQTAWTICSPDG